ncbi:MAG: small basic protein [Candidatus Omnitrophica bacterium]|nr:small basic protein [Candidatus Omnitrophota bacterium]
MTLHPSLKRAQKLSAARSVMSRTERIKWLMDREKWHEDHPVTGLPKIKVVKLKAAKKERPQEAESSEEKKEESKK